MATVYSQRDKNIRLTWVYLTGFFVFVVIVGWVFAQIYNNSFILYYAIIFSLILNVASYWWSDKIVLGLNRAKEIKPTDGPEAKEVYRLVENLAITAGLPTPKIYLIDDPGLNAFATGRNPERAVVAVTRGLLQKLNKTEVEGVIAHELSHIGNRDILLGTVITVLVGFISILADMFRHSLWVGDRDENKNNSLLLVVGLLLSVLAPLSAMLIQLAISRKREFLADSSAVLLTRYPAGLIGALRKISQNPQLKRSSRATAHLFIASPFQAKNINKLFSTHPPIEERIKRLQELAV